MSSSASPEKEVNAIRMKKKVIQGNDAATSEPGRPDLVAKVSNEVTSAAVDPVQAFRLERKAMEEERLARRDKGKRKYEPEPQEEPSAPPKLQYFNSREGFPDSWQLGESTEQFMNRLPPLQTSALTCDWIWAENPHKEATRARLEPDVGSFTICGEALLAESLGNRQHISSNGQKAKKGMLLKEESNALQLRIANLAKQYSTLR